MFESDQSPKPSELFRDRTVARYHAVIDGIHMLDNVDISDPESRAATGHTPKSSTDTALTAFAQLGALRLDATRALVSLIDSKYQYILAESTKTLSSQLDTRHDAADALQYGNVAFPRHKNLCHTVMTKLGDTNLLELESDNNAHVDILTINDLQQDERFQGEDCIKVDPNLRFYAGVPLRAANGCIIGVYAVLSDDPRNNDLSQKQRLFMQDMATTIVKHLDSVVLQAEQARREKLVRALESFLTGLSELKSEKDSVESWQAGRSKDAPLIQETDIPGPEVPVETNASLEPTQLWEKTLPVGAKKMFSRAAAILRAGADFDGVAFFLMPTGRASRRNLGDHTSPPPFPTSPGHTERPSTSSECSQALITRDEGQADHTETIQFSSSADDSSDHEKYSHSKPCPVLGYSLSQHVKNKASSPPDLSIRDLSIATGNRVRGRVVSLSRTGQAFPGDTSSSSSGGEASGDVHRRRGKKRAYIEVLLKLDSGGRSFLVYPLWDFERQRFFAACICWTQMTRDLRPNEFPYVRIFSVLVMHTLNHLDALEGSRAKTTFMSSISHEMRSPLHGILGGANFLDSGNLDRFQQEMLDSIKNCGHTLLDTMEHIMDFAKINSFVKTNIRSLHRRSSSQTSQRSRRSSQDSAVKSATANIDLTLITEEVVEAVILGFAVRQQFSQVKNVGSKSRHINSKGSMSVQDVIDDGADNARHRGNVRVVLKMCFHENWKLALLSQPGAWRRIIMNLFGNALKYTQNGLILVSLAISEVDEDSETVSVTFTVEDTGQGISSEYQNKHLFKPFTQEDPFSAGTGLGLSIVSQIVGSLGGRLDLSSEKDIGTTVSVTVRIPVQNARDENTGLEDLLQAQTRLKDHKICVLTNEEVEKWINEPIQKPEAEHVASIVNSVRDWLKGEVIVMSSWTPGIAQLVICAEPAFKHLEAIRSSEHEGGVPPVLMVAYDALEMFVLRSDARIKSKESVVEVSSQPCGPRKLGRALLELLDRAKIGRRPSVVDGVSDTEASESLPHDTLYSMRRQSETSTTRVPSKKATENDVLSSLNLDTDLPVLIVDDNPVNLKLLEAQIKKMKLSYKHATNGKEALDVYKNFEGQFACVLMDISMPIMDGISSTRAIRQFERENKLRKRPIIALTGLASASARHEAMEAEMSKFLTKPVPFRLLGEIIRDILDKF